MADLTISISNGLNFFGGTPPSLYGTAVYGTDVYGAGSVDGIEDVGKFIADTLGSDSAMQIAVEHIIGMSLSLSSETTSEILTNGIWTYVFPDNVTDAEDRASNTWTAASSQSSSYSNVSPPSTSWS